MKTGNPYGPWWSHTIVMFDTETTGLKDDDRVIELGAVRFEDGEAVDQWGTLLYPGREIPEEASAIHGITTFDVSTAPPFVGSLPQLLRLCRNAWPAAYNADFDKRFLFRELGLLSQELDLSAFPMFDPSVRWIDPLIWLRFLDGLWGKNKLAVACERHGVKLENAHRATDDAIAAGKLLYGPVKERLPPWTITELLRLQTMHGEKQEEERRAWFAKKGIKYR